MRQVPTFQRIILYFIIIVDELGLWILLPVIAPLIVANSNSYLTQHLSLPERNLLLGLIFGIQPLLGIIAAPLWGFLSDHLGRKKMLSICLGGTLIGYFFYYLSFHDKQLFLLLLARIIVGGTTASQTIVQSMVAVSSDKSLKLTHIASMACAMTMPIIIGPLLAGFFSNNHWVTWFNQATPFLVATGLSSLNFILFLCIYREEAVITTSNYRLSSIKRIVYDMRCLLSQERLINLLLCFFSLELFWSLYFQALPLLLAGRYHFKSLQISLFISYLGLAMVFSLLVLIRKSSFIRDIHHMLRVSLLLGFISLLLMFILPRLNILIITAAPLAMSIGLAYACLITLLSNTAPRAQQGLVMGITNALLALAFSISGFFAAILTSFNAKLPLLVCSALALCAFGFRPRSRIKSGSGQRENAIDY